MARPLVDKALQELIWFEMRAPGGEIVLSYGQWSTELGIEQAETILDHGELEAGDYRVKQLDSKGSKTGKQIAVIELAYEED